MSKGWEGFADVVADLPAGATAGDQRLHAEVPDQTAVLVVVVDTIGEDHVRAAPGPATRAGRLAHEAAVRGG
ncbi:hypothetical protein [Streptomyces filipinensis]|uniref:hypothetical protein n=1 Tax=Streptomyces filipinensis TaxID=66887 RepID=UPI0035712DB4